jgi:hypothetical protein
MFFGRLYAGGRCYLNKSCARNVIIQFAPTVASTSRCIFNEEKKELFIQYLASMRFGLELLFAVSVGFNCLGFSIYFYV